MREANRRPSEAFWLRGYVLTLAVFWTAAVGATLAWELVNQRNHARDLARAEARGLCKRNEGFLRWYSALGGLYAQVGKATQPNPKLAYLPDRDAVLPSGDRVTLVNPINMLAQLSAYSDDKSTLHARPTTFEQTDYNPQTAPDLWEIGALNAIERGGEEVSAVRPIEQEQYLRLMRPLELEWTCVKCHPDQASHTGQIYGGFSVSIPMSVVWPNQRDQMYRSLLGYGGMWLVGLAGIGLGSRSLRRQMERRRQAEQTLREHQTQMLAAQQIQKRLLPSGPPQLAGFDVAGASFPAEFTSGDYFDYIPMCDECVGLAIADVCGHGLGPALLMASTQAFLRSSAEVYDDLGEIVGHVNRCLQGVAEQHRFVTFFLGRLDVRARTFTYVSAGHPAGYVLDASGIVKSRLESTAVPLGIAMDTEFSSGNSVSLEAGDTVLLVTDGILEARSPTGEVFGAERALDTVRAAQPGKAAEIVDRLFQAVRAFCGPEKPVDDVTAMVIQVEATS